MNEALSAKVIAALRPDQQSALRSWQSQQIRSRRIETLKRDMTAAGVALTPEQLPQIEAIYTEESQARTQMLLQTNGTPAPATVAQLETQTMLKVVRILTAEQKKALAEAMTRARTTQP
jgi:hypothetical protein